LSVQSRHAILNGVAVQSHGMEHTVDQAPHLTTEELAERERTSPATVRFWRYAGTGPTGFRAGRRVLYPEAAVIAWERQRMQQQAGSPAA